ncbi:triple gene block protein 3 [Cucumber vein-clearing virus]|uniref:Movement protein TGBp3 n=1 Tax=Cucumber vein-clearing virus TaxID=1092564 RepID=G5D8V8_9VIRU|nr:triple gene block protein 3 [Cucumber vein-clearing virus]AEP83729.1 triple gene block protein 3 [Cucumber vein-clearing virus]WOL52752.1 triple gene block protein 3 [Cucumber vein-clearing virus]
MLINVNFADVRTISGILIILISYLCLIFSILRSERACEIVLTGESIAISSCKLDSNFISALESLKMLNSCPTF